MKIVANSRRMGMMMIVIGGILGITTLTTIVFYLGAGFNIRSLIGHLLRISFAVYYLIAGIKNVSTPWSIKPSKTVSVILVVLTSIDVLISTVFWIITIVRFGPYVFSDVRSILVLLIFAACDVGCLYLACQVIREIDILLGKRKNKSHSQNSVLYANDFRYLSDENTKTSAETFTYLEFQDR